MFAMLNLEKMVPVRRIPCVISWTFLELFPVLFQENLKWHINAFSGWSSPLLCIQGKDDCSLAFKPLAVLQAVFSIKLHGVHYWQKGNSD